MNPPGGGVTHADADGHGPSSNKQAVLGETTELCLRKASLVVNGVLTYTEPDRAS